MPAWGWGEGAGAPPTPRAGTGGFAWGSRASLPTSRDAALPNVPGCPPWCPHGLRGQVSIVLAGASCVPRSVGRPREWGQEEVGPRGAVGGWGGPLRWLQAAGGAVGRGGGTGRMAGRPRPPGATGLRAGRSPRPVPLGFCIKALGFFLVVFFFNLCFFLLPSARDGKRCPVGRPLACVHGTAVPWPSHAVPPARVPSVPSVAATFFPALVNESKQTFVMFAAGSWRSAGLLFRNLLAKQSL